MWEKVRLKLAQKSRYGGGMAHSLGLDERRAELFHRLAGILQVRRCI